MSRNIVTTPPFYIMDENNYFLYCILLILFFALGFLIAKAPDFNLNISKESKSKCSNLSLQDTADCLKNQLEKFYNYNISNIGKELTLKELKKQGGVCSHYADWYYNNINGFYKKEVTVLIGNGFAHKFTIMSSEDGYCILDQMNVECTEFENKNGSPRKNN